MKKLIAIILSLALVVCMFAVNVSAADVTVTEAGTHNVVGTHQKYNTIADGLTAAEFSSGKSAQAIVNLTLSDAQSRYAVDIEFGGTSNYNQTVDGLTWNVNTLKYEINSTSITDLKYEFTVINYSDKPVAAGVACSPDTLLKVGFEGAQNFTVEGNTHGTLPANVKKGSVKATLSPADEKTWVDVINGLVTTQNTGTVTIATFTITVSKP